MLTQQFPFLDPARLSLDFAEQLRALAQDCADLVRDRSLTLARLRTAPTLDRYVPLVTPIGLHLVGQVSGHEQSDAVPIVTSQLWFADPEGLWIRTQSCLYRLGRPGDPEGHERIQSSALMVFDSRDGDDDDGEALASRIERRPP